MSVPQRPTSPLAGLYYDVCLAIRERAQQRNPFGAFSFDELEALSSLRAEIRGLDEHCYVIEHGLMDELSAALSEDRVQTTRAAYDAARELALPTCHEFIKWCHATHGLTYTHSLNAIPLNSLLALEVRSYSDATLSKLIGDFRKRLIQIRGVEDHHGFGQAYELFSEAVVYAYLKDRLTSVEKINEQGGKVGSTPDFKCSHGGKEFYIEVKSFDIVDGVYRAKEMMYDGLDANIDLEAQIMAGHPVAMAETEISPYKRANEKGAYDPRSLIKLIEVIQSKSRSAFKSSQFKAGPTFALASMGRLILPGDAGCVQPYYIYDDYDGRVVISGVLWQCCFGRQGGVILRHAELNSGSVEGYLASDGLYRDELEPLPGIGFIAMERAGLDSKCYGICNDARALAEYGWDLDDVKNILHDLCEAYNDGENGEANVTIKV
ncbi:hypothetical protein [Burkholderia gladioli]|uniref:hypothetical protein n=1 Tax=Burkholderia gladioli TaxID=28095 RepID=UPI00163FF0C6|nr:hypothetical protein [Burkholderia gladioli]